MQGAVNYARGWVRLVACGPFPERLLNLCAQRNVTFWAVEWLDGQTLRLTLLRRHMKQLQELARRAGCTIEVERRAGLPDFLARFRRRYAFLVGLTLSVLAVCVLSRFVLTIELTGNQRVPDAVILSELRRQGLRLGVYGPGLDTKQIALDAQLALDDLSWMSINLYGTRVQVVVREVVEPPALLDESEKCDIQAAAGGIVRRVEAVAGQSRVQPGDTVTAGQVLISGTVAMEGPQYSDVATRYLHVRAAGSVWARTWRTVSASTPLTVTTKSYSGQSARRWSLTVLDRRINFYRNGSISWEYYDKISETHPAVLPSGQTLPLALTCETLTAWQPEQTQVNADAAQDLLEQQLLLQLQELVGEDGTVVTVSWSARIAHGVLTVTGVAECEEQIGREVPAQDGGGQTAG